MQTPNGQTVRLNGHSVNTAGNARKVSKAKLSVSPAQAEFIKFFSESELPPFSEALKLTHDFVLDHTDVPLDDEEKFALYNLKQLWEEIDRLIEES